MNKLSSADRLALIKLAASLPAGSSERRAILAGLGKKASGDARKVTEKIVKALAKSDGVPVSHFSSAQTLPLEKAIDKMISEGAAFDARAIKQIADGFCGDEYCFHKFSQYRSYKELCDAAEILREQ